MIGCSVSFDRHKVALYFKPIPRGALAGGIFMTKASRAFVGLHPMQPAVVSVCEIETLLTFT